MSKKKEAKRLRREAVEQFEEWLGERSQEELKALRIRMGVTSPSFKVTLNPASQSAQTGSEGI